MIAFEDIQDVEDWLGPLGYDAFWDAVAPWGIYAGADRAHFDEVLVKGVTDVDTMLTCLKAEVRMEMTTRFDLKERYYAPTTVQYLRHVH
ncbi:hypothetical protein ACOTTU_19215 [Roseobacter sp. EG26]|uniref:hypothetical protein n=1 Tax=Roseobacter sp. EG26 TaxID=3412477 RepID=UPI003CE4B480